ncbi:MAG: PAS domain S-box protein [Ignavibacteriaceae bacterium]|nr:PAS domain S-box protein [Ignavibacteriaceae bacterium]
MEKEIRILTVESSPEDLKLILSQLDKDGIIYSSLNVKTKDDFIKGLADFNPDIILTDFSIPAFEGLTPIDLIEEISPLTPVIIVTGSNDEETAVDCIKKGANDFILKDHIVRLGLAVRRALENKKLIEEKDLDEKKILKLNRTYAVIGQINEMIVRVRDREKLFEEACKIAVETGKYRLVWVGLFDKKEKIILPHVWNGFEEEFLEEIKKMSPDDILRNDPIQSRILMGSYFVCNNIIKEDSGFILRKNGLAHGFHSLISLPLTLRSKVIGSFNIYADEPDFFNEEEIKLLIEVAGDISYSIETIANEKAITVSELRYRRLFESAKDGIIILNADNGEIVDVNPFITNNLDYLKEDLIGKHLWEIGFLKDSIFNKDSFLELLEHGYIRYEDLPLRKKDGTSMDVEFVSNIYLVDNVKVIQCNIRDITARKRSEEALRNSETRMRTLVQTIPDLIWLKDVDGVYLSCNKMFSRFFGAAEDDIVGKTDYDFINSDLADSFLEYDRIAMAAGKPTINEEWVTFADDGHQAFLETIKTPMCDTRGVLIGILGIGRDITSRKLSEDSLLESEVKYRLLAESSPEAIFLIDANGFMIYLNSTAAIQFKADPSEIIGKHLNDIFPPDLAQENLAEIQNVISTKQPMSFEKEMKLPAGTVWTANRLTPVIKDNQVVSVLGLSSIITNQKMAELELRKISSAVEQGPASVIITNRDGNIEYVNRKFCDLTGYSKEEVKNKNPGILGSGFQDKLFYKDLWDTILAGNNWNGEILNKKKNGDLYWVYALISPLISENGDITNFVAVKEDITEKKNMESKLIEAKEKAESANKLKDAFIANMSHEIRTPLNGIMGMSGLIRDIFPGKIKKEDEELFEGINFSSKRIIRTIDLILNYSRLQVGEFPVFRKNLSISSLCENLVKEYTPVAKRKSLELKYQDDCGNVFLSIDEYSTIMAISNLIDNAIIYTNKGFVNLNLYKDIDGNIILVVSDSGIGMSEEYLKNTFEPYRQEQIGYNRTYEGIGLALSLVKKVLALEDASISVESKKGEGSAFTINFGKEIPPAEKITGNKIADIIPSSKDHPGKAIVLIVEDDIMNQVTIKRFLNIRYNTIITSSSDEALEILKKEKVDLILMDVSIMGKQNGLELTKDLKASKEYSHIPVIAITAHAFEQDRNNALASGCDNFLAKPFTKQELLNMVDLYFHKSN